MRLSEIYTSIQGEGPRAGTPTRFIRFAGCNLRCPLWPCDTQHAIQPAIFEKEQVHYTPMGLLEAVAPWPNLLCLTGGEPFIQKKDELEKFVDLATVFGYTVECFTNGTIEYPDWAIEKVHFIMDWKLPGSGEDHTNQVRVENAKRLKDGDYIKFVISDREDYETAKRLYQQFDSKVKAVWSYGAAWGKIETQELVEWAIKDELPWQLNVQVHNYIWDRDKRGI